jgi:hypothetical protein
MLRMKGGLCLLLALLFAGCAKEAVIVPEPVPASVEAPAPVADVTPVVVPEPSVVMVEAPPSVKAPDPVVPVATPVPAIVVKPKAPVAKPAPMPASPETLLLPASRGEIRFSHGKHAAAQGCAACHPDGKPGPLGLNRTTGHALCQGCHKKSGAGPTTACNGCHGNGK